MVHLSDEESFGSHAMADDEKENDQILHKFPMASAFVESIEGTSEDDEEYESSSSGFNEDLHNNVRDYIEDVLPDRSQSDSVNNHDVGQKSQSESLHAEDDDDESVLIANTNKVLTSLGIATKHILSMEELRRVAPSMFVGVVEALFKMKIDGIIRSPQSKQDYIHNAQLMIDYLSEQMQLDVSYITGDLIWEGNFEALSNLVSIFLRLLSLTGSNESLQSLGSHDEEGEDEEYHRRFSYPSGDSISTKDSLLLPKPSSSLPRRNVQGRTRYYYENPAYSQRPTAEQRFTQKFLAESFRKSEKLLQSELKQYHANRRRSFNNLYQKNLLEYRNQQKKQKCKEIRRNQFKQTLIGQQRSFDLKRKNAEAVALHKIYDALFREVARQRAEERKNEHQRIQQLKGKLQNEVESLDRLYREKLQLIDQQRRNTNQISRSTYESVLVELSKNLEKKLDYQLNVGSQSRDREMLWKEEAYKKLLQKIHGTKWEDFLRVHPTEQKSERSREVGNSKLSTFGSRNKKILH